MADDALGGEPIGGDSLEGHLVVGHPIEGHSIEGISINPTATLLEHALLTQGFMGTSKAVFPRRLRPQSPDSTWENLVGTRK